MATPAMHSAARAPEYGDFDIDTFAAAHFSPDDRIGAPYRGSSRRASRWIAVAALVSLSAAWVQFGLPVDVLAWLSEGGSTLVQSSSLAPSSSPPPSTVASAPAAPLPPLPVPQDPPPAGDAVAEPAAAAKLETPPAAALGTEPSAVSPPVTPKSGPSGTSPITTASLAAPGALPVAPAAPPADPLQERAVAAGLHPDISRALLERLSPADYRNAATAIKTALADKSDTAVIAWPKHRRPDLALFKVKFVAGAAPGCRRYVVTVTKDGWLTTALPVEKCG